MEEAERRREENLNARRRKDDTTESDRTNDYTVIMQNADEGEMESKLDISSGNFDPFLALYSPKIKLPYPDIRCFNNIAEYESFLKGGRGRAKPENVEKKMRKARKGVADPERIERLKKLMVNVAPEEGEGSGASRRPPRKQKAPKNVLTKMPLHAGSPLGELHRCVQDRIRVKVHIRTFKGLRGVCSGFVVAFDKFWNMAMVDVDETYRKPLLGEAIHHDRALTVTRLFARLKLQENSESTLAEQKQPGARASGCLEPASPMDHALGTKGTGLGSGCRELEQGAGTPGTGVGSELKWELRGKGKVRPKVDYQVVHTRHINQLFIRGENVLLVNLQS